MNTRHAGGFAATIAVALVVALATTALANRVVVRDSAGDTRVCKGPHLDIRSAIAGHASKGRLKHVVKVQRARSFAKPLIGIKVGKSKRIRYTVWGGFGAPQVVDNKKSEVTGGVKTKRRGNRWILLFHPRALGNPSEYRWQAFTYAGGDCPNSDYAPNRKKGFRRHRLG